MDDMIQMLEKIKRPEHRELAKSRLLCWFSLEIVSRSNKRAYLIIRVSSNLFMEFPKAISMQEVLKSGFRHIL